MIEVRRLGPQIGAEIRGRRRQDARRRGVRAIYRAWLDHNVVVVPDQELEIEDFLRYSRRFGWWLPHPVEDPRAIPSYPEITMLGVNKFGADGQLDMAIYRRGAEGWHTDGAYDQEPFKATQLYALAVPSTRRRHVLRQHVRGLRRAAAAAEGAARGTQGRLHLRRPQEGDGAARTRRTATGRRSSIRSSARIPRPGARGCTSIRARSCASRASRRPRATR